MKFETVDIVIVGGGIAGLTLAKFLAEEGVNFILLEEHSDYFQKPCGEGVYPELVGYTFYEFYGSKVGIERIIHETLISTKYGDIILKMPVLMSNKYLIEREIARQVTQKGGNIVLNSRVNGIKSVGDYVAIFPQNIRGKIIVGADGINSIVRKFIGVPRPSIGIASCGTCSYLKKSSDQCHIEVKKEVTPWGFSWFFPKLNGWNIGIGTTDPRYFKRNLKIFQERFPGVREWKTGIIPVSKPVRSYGKYSILVGDAAAQVFASTGAGILSSMVCAKIASEILVKESRRDFRYRDLSIYEKKWRKKLYQKLVRSYIYYSTLFRLEFVSEYLFYVFFKMGCKIQSFTY